MSAPKASYKKAHDPLRAIVMRHNDNGSLSPWIEAMEWVFAKMQSPEVELAMHRTKEQGGGMRECMNAALTAAFGDND